MCVRACVCACVRMCVFVVCVCAPARTCVHVRMCVCVCACVCCVCVATYSMSLHVKKVNTVPVPPLLIRLTFQALLALNTLRRDMSNLLQEDRRRISMLFKDPDASGTCGWWGEINTKCMQLCYIYILTMEYCIEGYYR